MNPATSHSATRPAVDYQLPLDITSVTNRGHGVGRHQGFVVFVPFTWPGDLVTVEVKAVKKRHAIGKLISVDRPSNDRTSPRCEHFSHCGGCHYQHVSYSAQLEWKRRQLEQLLAHMTEINAVVRDVIPSPKPFGYRSKLTPLIRQTPQGPLPSLHAFDDPQSLVPIRRCPLATDAINESLSRSTFDATNAPSPLLIREDDNGVHIGEEHTLSTEIGGLRFRYPSSAFFQVNPFILPAFVDHVVGEATAHGCESLIDIFCGVGLFALTAARHVQSGMGIELSEQMVAFAERNAIENGIDHIDFQAADAKHALRAMRFPASRTAIVLDPPRRGCPKPLLENLGTFGAPTIVYVSCDPPTQLRDLRILKQSGYRVDVIQPFDLFAQTYHLECAITLRK